MFTGIVQGVARVAAITDRPGLRSFELALPAGFDSALEIGASVACDGVCLTVTARPAPDRACFDVMQQSLGLTTLGQLAVGSAINVERAAKDGAGCWKSAGPRTTTCCASACRPATCATSSPRVTSRSMAPA
jgi:riboflavin synthase